MIRITTANLDKNKPGDLKYKRHLYYATGNHPALFFFQESGSGLKSVTLVGIKLKLYSMMLIVIGNIGVHRAIRRAGIRLEGKRVVVFSVHGLHRKTSGLRAQRTYYDILEKRIARLNKKGIPWVIGLDANTNIFTLAAQLGGTGYGKGIIGFIVSKQLRVDSLRLDYWGVNAKVTDHPAARGILRFR